MDQGGIIFHATGLSSDLFWLVPATEKYKISNAYFEGVSGPYKMAKNHRSNSL
jgi:hypothetical protein